MEHASSSRTITMVAGRHVEIAVELGRLKLPTPWARSNLYESMLTNANKILGRRGRRLHPGQVA